MSPSRRLYLPLALLAAASLAGDLLCRTLAGSANQERMFKAASQGVSQLPETIGPWRAVNDQPLTEDVLRMLECRAHESRLYENEQTSERVGMILLVGPAGPLVAHTAEICYGSVAFDIVEPSHAETIRGSGERQDVFQQVTFRANSLTGQKQRVYYSWRKFDGAWQAPDDPRWLLGGQPVLYKLQLTSADGMDSEESPASDPTLRFLTDLLPVLDKILAPK